MSVVAFIRRMLDSGFSHDDALRAAEAFEATTAEMIPSAEAMSAGAARTRRWRERRASQTVTDRHEASRTVTAVTPPEAAETGTPFSQENIPPSPPKGGSSPTGDRSLGKPARKRREGSRFCPEDFEPSPDHHAQAAGRGLTAGDFERALSRFRRHEFPRAYTDWNRCFANWLDREKPSDDRQSPRSKSDHLAAIARAMEAAGGGPGGSGGHPPQPGDGRGVPALRPAA